MPLPEIGSYPAWLDAARRLAIHDVPPDEIVWGRGGVADLFAGAPPPDCEGPARVTATKALIGIAKSALCHNGSEAPALMYRALHRHQRDRGVLANPADPLIRSLAHLKRPSGATSTRCRPSCGFAKCRGAARMQARAAASAPGSNPDHLILEAAAPFFARRFANMDGTVATPQGVARFEAGTLTFYPPVERPDVPEDASEGLWGTCFANIFNPARLHLKAMRPEMPLKYRNNLPETRLIPQMLAEAEARVDAMRTAVPAKPPAHARRILDRLPGRGMGASPGMAELPSDTAAAKASAAGCGRCGLREAASQTVCGEGDPSAGLMIVGEQPGDAEDIAGRRFVGPAGEVLSSIMAEAGTGRVWKTNAVKHFKFRLHGKRRLHRSPGRSQIDHCRWWLDLERRFVRPRITLALGASAACALTGDATPLASRRGKVKTARDGGPAVVTWHPSYLLRTPHAEAAGLRADLLADLRACTNMVDTGR